MSELIRTNENAEKVRWRLLAGASIWTLMGAVSVVPIAKADDGDRPTVWIELGGQLSRLADSHQIFSTPLMDARPSFFDPSEKFEKSPSYSFDEEGTISIQPGGSHWLFSAGIRYGRAKSNKHITQQTSNPYPFTNKYGSPVIVSHYARKFAETISQNSEQHTIVDFQVGREVGLGMFGKETISILSAGVRFAQLKSTSNAILRSDPDWSVATKYVGPIKLPIQNYHSNAASFYAERSFSGFGPSLSWKASAPFAGSRETGELTADWGFSGALLFGRQKTRTHHQTTGQYHYWQYRTTNRRHVTYQGPATPDHVRTRSVTVPDVGGFAGISLRYPNAKVSFGYRADFLFGAIDGGIDARKTYDRSFYGPYATISIGLGG